MKFLEEQDTRFLAAILSLIFGGILVAINMFMPPPGEVNESIIYIFAQLLIFSATLLGVDAVVSKYIKPKQ